LFYKNRESCVCFFVRSVLCSLAYFCLSEFPKSRLSLVARCCLSFSLLFLPDWNGGCRARDGMASPFVRVFLVLPCFLLLALKIVASYVCRALFSFLLSLVFCLLSFVSCLSSVPASGESVTVTFLILSLTFLTLAPSPSFIPLMSRFSSALLPTHSFLPTHTLLYHACTPPEWQHTKRNEARCICPVRPPSCNLVRDLVPICSHFVVVSYSIRLCGGALGWR
jgi:hypothetical protein